jgi:hypothetical protein
VVFKPLCDAHRTAELLDRVRADVPGRALWCFRSPDDRVRSAVAKFGPSALVALRTIAAGRGDDLWQAQGLTPALHEVVASFDYTTMSAESAAALLWYVRNQLFFDQGLHERPDVRLVSYDDFVARPAHAFAAVCAHIGIAAPPAPGAAISSRRAPVAPLALDPVVRELADAIHARLVAAYGDQEASAGTGEADGSAGRPLP